MPSTNKNENISRIVSKLNEGACVTTSRNDVHYVVTEYGSINLRGLTISQRAKALISIAHPKFREIFPYSPITRIIGKYFTKFICEM